MRTARNILPIDKAANGFGGLITRPPKAGFAPALLDRDESDCRESRFCILLSRSSLSTTFNCISDGISLSAACRFFLSAESSSIKKYSGLSLRDVHCPNAPG